MTCAGLPGSSCTWVIAIAFKSSRIARFIMDAKKRKDSQQRKFALAGSWYDLEEEDHSSAIKVHGTLPFADIVEESWKNKQCKNSEFYHKNCST